MIDKIGSNPISDCLGKTTNKQDGGDAAPVTSGADASLQVDFGSLIDKAAQAQDSDASAVKKARQLLLSGQLDSEENILEAADNILKYGI
jgi:hypothetical protein